MDKWKTLILDESSRTEDECDDETSFTLRTIPRILNKNKVKNLSIISFNDERMYFEALILQEVE